MTIDRGVDYAVFVRSPLLADSGSRENLGLCPRFSVIWFWRIMSNYFKLVEIAATRGGNIQLVIVQGSTLEKFHAEREKWISKGFLPIGEIQHQPRAQYSDELYFQDMVSISDLTNVNQVSSGNASHANDHDNSGIYCNPDEVYEQRSSGQSNFVEDEIFDD